MQPPRATQLRWMRRTAVLPAAPRAVQPVERLIAALAERPQTVAQLAQRLGLAQPTVLEQVRRALRDGIIVEVEPPPGQRRSAAERYYAPAVPVIRPPDREILESACRGLADEMAAVLLHNRGDLLAAFATTHLAREGWQLADLWPYLQELVCQLALERVDRALAASAPGSHGLAWVEDLTAEEAATDAAEEGVA